MRGTDNLRGRRDMHTPPFYRPTCENDALQAVSLPRNPSQSSSTQDRASYHRRESNDILGSGGGARNVNNDAREGRICPSPLQSRRHALIRDTTGPLDDPLGFWSVWS